LEMTHRRTGAQCYFGIGSNHFSRKKTSGLPDSIARHLGKDPSVTDITERGTGFPECAYMVHPLKRPKTSLLLERRSPLRPYVIAAAIGLSFGLFVAGLTVLLIH
jgi:hypothetical protein